MILQSLHSYYQRLKENPANTIAKPGFSSEKIHAVLVLNPAGECIQFKDLREPSGKKKVPVSLIVPQGVKRTAGIKPNFLWDNTKYVLGAEGGGTGPKHEDTFNAFRKFHVEMLKACDDTEAQALLLFLENWKPEKAAKLEYWEDLAGGNVVFQLDGKRSYIHDNPAIQDIWKKHREQTDDENQGICLVTGDKAAVARLHPSIKGVRDSQSSGASIVSFNLNAFCSYNKEQSYNAPVSEDATFAYTTALNYLLRAGSNQKIQIGDATTVFWTERESPVEGFFGMVLNPADDTVDNREVEIYLDAVRQGKLPADIDPDIKFYILGLSPNASRLAVRFWHVSDVGDVSGKLGQHFHDLEIVKSYENEPDSTRIGIRRILFETVNKNSQDKSPPPLLAGALMKSILQGTLYPQSLLSAVINRIRAEQNINYVKSAVIKAVLNRKSRILNLNMEVSMALDKNNTNIAYLLGRLFAALEKAQKDAIPGANTTIKDRFYGSASATPKVVFPQLLRLSQHHIEKAEYGRVTDKMIEEIVADIPEFPAHMNLDQQGMFAIGYYHQRQDIYTKKEKE